MTSKATREVRKAFRRRAVPSDYSERPWCYLPPISAYTAAFRTDLATPAADLAPEVEAMWATHCREHRPTNTQPSGR